MPEAKETRYIGDSVYVKYDGNGFSLMLDSHEGEAIVYLEPEVLKALVQYVKEAGFEV